MYSPSTSSVTSATARSLPPRLAAADPLGQFSLRKAGPRVPCTSSSPLPSATASGSPNRRRSRIPVRHMSVISPLTEHAVARCGARHRRLERVIGSSSPKALAGQCHITERNSGLGRLARRRESGPCVANTAPKQAVRRPPPPPVPATVQHKIAKKLSDLRKLQSVSGGRCWVRTNVG